MTVQANPTGQTCTTANGTGTIASANITSVTVTCTANTAGSGSDDFNRANGSLGPNWTDASDGGLTITGQQVAGTAANSYSGDIRTAETYPADQFSQITLTSTQLTGGQWIGAAIRMQNGGQNQYLGIYFWNNGSPDLMLFKRNASNWTQLGTTYNSGPLSAGTTLQVQATGSTISLLQNGVQRISATDTSVATGAPGIMAYGTGKADNWSGGAASSGGGTATYSVGGTLSGATGTVILQDNGGDNLTVTANGPFTFGTPLADGASYNVTVLTNPAGQTCTLASGTGTVHAANVTNVVVTCTANAAGSGSDDFNRADGSLGPDWTDISDGGLAISGQQVTGTSANGVSGDIRTAETYPTDQFSQITLTSTQLTREPVDRGSGPGTERWPERLRRRLQLEQRQPGRDAVPAQRGQLDPARHHLQQRAALRRHHAEANGDWLDAVSPGQRHRAGRRWGHHAGRRSAGHHGLRRRPGGQLVRRGRGL